MLRDREIGKMSYSIEALNEGSGNSTTDSHNSDSVALNQYQAIAEKGLPQKNSFMEIN